LNQLIDIYEIQQGGCAIESDLKVIIFNPIASAIPKWLMFRLMR
jgi:hypothetical protein